MRDALQLPPKRHTQLRAVVLLSAALAAGFRGLAYLPAATSDMSVTSLTYVEAWVPLWVWSFVWLAGFVFLTVSVFVNRLAIPAMSVFVGMHVLWGTSFIMSWLFLETPRSWVTGTSVLIMGVFAAVLTILIERPRADPEES